MNVELDIMYMIFSHSQPIGSGFDPLPLKCRYTYTYVYKLEKLEDLLLSRILFDCNIRLVNLNFPIGSEKEIYQHTFSLSLIAILCSMQLPRLNDDELLQPVRFWSNVLYVGQREREKDRKVTHISVYVYSAQMYCASKAATFGECFSLICLSIDGWKYGIITCLIVSCLIYDVRVCTWKCGNAIHHRHF